MRIPVRLRAPLRKTARNSSIAGVLIVLGLVWALVTSRWFPAHALVVIWWPFEVLGWLVVLVASALTFDSLRAWIHPARHEAIVRLAQRGDVGRILETLLVELDGPSERHGAATFTARHVLVETWWSFAIVPTDQIVWCWAVETEHRKYGVIPVGRSFRVFMGLRGGELLDFASTAGDHENVLLCIAQRPGDRVVGFDETLRQAWDDDALLFTRGVDLLAREGRLHEGPIAVLDAIRRATASLPTDARAALAQSRETLERARETLDRLKRERGD